MYNYKDTRPHLSTAVHRVLNVLRSRMSEHRGQSGMLRTICTHFTWAPRQRLSTRGGSRMLARWRFSSKRALQAVCISCWASAAKSRVPPTSMTAYAPSTALSSRRAPSPARAAPKQLVQRLLQTPQRSLESRLRPRAEQPRTRHLRSGTAEGHRLTGIGKLEWGIHQLDIH